MVVIFRCEAQRETMISKGCKIPSSKLQVWSHWAMCLCEGQGAVRHGRALDETTARTIFASGENVPPRRRCRIFPKTPVRSTPSRSSEKGTVMSSLDDIATGANAFGVELNPEVLVEPTAEYCQWSGMSHLFSSDHCRETAPRIPIMRTP